MNKKFLFAAAIAPMAILASCSDNTIEEAIVPAVSETSTDVVVSTDDSPLAVYLTDQQGNPVESVSGEFGTYNLHIEGAEAWIIQSNQAFVKVPYTQGSGRAVVPVYVANSWDGNNREALITVKTLDLDATTRGTSEQVAENQIGIRQASGYSTSYINRMGSVTGVGYAYNPLRSDNVLLAIGQPIFDVPTLCENGMIIDNANYINNETLIIESSDSALHNQLMVKGGISGKFATIAFSGSGSFNKVKNADESNWYSVMTKNTVVFQREMNYLDVIDSENVKLSNGFKKMQNTLIKAIADAKNDKAKVRMALDDFFSHYGPFFIHRAQIGAHLDYTCTIQKALCEDSLDIAAAIQFKYKKEVVDTTKVKKTDEKADTTKVDRPHTEEVQSAVERFFAENSVSAANNKENNETGDKNADEDKKEKEYKEFDLNAAGKYQDFIHNVAENTNAKLEIKGGDGGVSILANGGKLNVEDLATWCSNITKDNAVLCDFLVAPIYLLFEDGSETWKYLKEFVDEGEIKD